MTRYLNLGKETVFGTPVAGARGIDAEIQSDVDEGIETAPPITFRSPERWNLGPYRVSHKISEFPMVVDEIGDLLLGALGAISTADHSPAYTHTIDMLESGDLPSYTLREGVNLTERIFAGCIVESLDLRLRQGSSAKMSASLFSGILETTTAIGDALCVTGYQPLCLAKTGNTVSIGSSPRAGKVYDISLSLKNTLIKDAGNLEGREWNVKRVGGLDVTGQISAWFDDIDELTRIKNRAAFNIVVDLKGALITGGYYEELILTIYNCVYEKAMGPGVIQQSKGLAINLPFTAHYNPDVVKTPIVATLNDRVSAH